MHPSFEKQKCPECGGVFESEKMIHLHGVFVCSRCKPILLQRLAEGGMDGATIPKRRPVAVWAALSVLAVTLGISIVRLAMRTDWNNPLEWVKFAIEILMLSVPLVCIFLGRGWARWLLAAYAFGGLCLAVPDVMRHQHAPSWLLTYGLKNAVVLGALVWLFLPSSTKWFRGKVNAAAP